MAELTFKIRVIEMRGARSAGGGGTSSYERTDPVLFLKVATYAGEKLAYHDPDDGGMQGGKNQLAAWMQLSLAIQRARSLTLGMPANSGAEAFYRKHTTLSEKLSHVSILAYIDRGVQHSFVHPPSDRRIDIFDVTVTPSMLTSHGVTYMGMLYSGATKEWF